MQAIPELAKVAGELYVFQRTPSTIDVRDQRATTPEEIETWANEPGWARARRARFAKISPGRTAIQANDDYLAGKVADFKERKQHERRLTPEELVEKQLDSNFRIMEQIRARVDAIVEDPKTAAALKPYYPYGCKRPDVPRRVPADVQPAARAPRRHRARWASRRSTSAASCTTASSIRSTCSSTRPASSGWRRRRSTWSWAATGRSLSEKWQTRGHEDLPRPAHARASRTCSSSPGPQGGGGSFNFTDAIDTHSDYVAWMLTDDARARAHDVVDVT